MARLIVLQRFEGLKTKSKLLATFGVISVIIGAGNASCSRRNSVHSIHCQPRIVA